eukprot:CAMPEP_0198458944 /NCGR_PEP_ID=MMETSP1453-20131121/38343_1 /TAXON_ID=1461543 ORGANISM="Unidentified sp., Strain RCC701" /NCGR_SAMPLE_ID=MMETSP1453 /ASSEMBLY_ACC=CAM_ASM_001118 /LENGTH=61 /DNA_ID=CAMNT_0044183863 /DNA_START=76 /DNA_END=258 /DNA_ORIENTATION=+
MQTELWPPNPKELDMAPVTSILTFVLAQVSMSMLSSQSLRLMVGWRYPVSMALRQAMASKP